MTALESGPVLALHVEPLDQSIARVCDMQEGRELGHGRRMGPWNAPVPARQGDDEACGSSILRRLGYGARQLSLLQLSVG